MKKFLESRIGKEVEVMCHGITVTGKVIKIDNEVLHIEKDDVTTYVNIEKIILVWDVREKKGVAPGFITADE